MDLRIALISLLAGSTLLAQTPAPAPVLSKPGDVAQTPPTPSQQDPDKPAPKPADVISELTRTKEQIEKEIEFVRSRAAQSGRLLSDKFAQRGLKLRSIDAGTSVVAPSPAAVQIKQARVMTDAEKAGVAADLLLMVDGRPIHQSAMDQMTGYLKGFPASGDDAMRGQRAMIELVRTESMLGATTVSAPAAEQHAKDAAQALRKGEAFAEVATRFGHGKTVLDEGKVKITRFCPFGLQVEAAAFAGKDGAISDPIRTANGYVVLQIDKQVKGDTADSDMVEARLIVLPYHPDPNELEQIRARASIGKIDIAVREAAVFDLLPVYLRPTTTKATEDKPAPQLDADRAKEKEAKIKAAKEPAKG